MDAVAPGLEREIRAVVHEEGDAAVLRDRAQRLGGAPDGVVIGALQAELNASDVARIECRGEQARKRRRLERRRRDQVEPCAGGSQASPL
jgi:hypothetical protein